LRGRLLGICEGGKDVGEMEEVKEVKDERQEV